MKIDATVPMREISLTDRQAILLDYEMMEAREVREKWNISNTTLQHIRFIHGRGGAAGGHYHKKLPKLTDPRIEAVKRMKAEGRTSQEASKASGIELSLVNRMWDKLNDPWE
jgi:DNA primase